MKICPICCMSEGHGDTCPMRINQPAILFTTGNAVMICLVALIITAAVLTAAGTAWKQYVDEWQSDRLAALTLAQYELATAEAQADGFNSNPIPGALQCVQPDLQHADMVVQR
jgi:hypothetical protein